MHENIKPQGLKSDITGTDVSIELLTAAIESVSFHRDYRHAVG